MRFSTLLKDIITIPAEVDCDILGLTLDSRRIKPQELFLAIKGTHLDGRQYIEKAISQGATAVLLDTDVQNEKITWHHQVPLIPIYHLKHQLGLLAARFYDYPADDLRLIGITGTNGKTSSAHYFAQILENLHIACGLIGTLGNGFYGKLSDSQLTTPDAITLQGMLHHLLHQGAKAVAMEVSSHSIDQGRIHGLHFELALFTNLTQDHLDYHGDMASYAATKRKFFAEYPIQHMIINADDTYGAQWMSELENQKSIFAYSVHKPASLAKHIPITYAKEAHFSLNNISAYINSPWGEGELLLPLIGQFNLSNALGVLTACCIYGIPFNDVLLYLQKLRPVSGRMQTLGGDAKALIVVDYAHTPDALSKVLLALRAHTQGKLICVFGCGGERDQGKRPLMATIAEQLADRVIVTNDNPRHEKPEDIVTHIMKGFSHPERVSVILDRSKAIKNSIQLASPKDCVLIAGKGAEHDQLIGDHRIPFDDVEKVKEYL